MASFLTQQFSVIPKRLRPTTYDIRAAGLWGGTAAFGALWLIQPWDFLASVIKGEDEEADTAGNAAPQARQSGTSSDSSEENDSNDSDDSKDESQEESKGNDDE